MIFYLADHGIWLEETTQVCQKVYFVSAQELILPHIPLHDISYPQ